MIRRYAIILDAGSAESKGAVERHVRSVGNADDRLVRVVREPLRAVGDRHHALHDMGTTVEGQDVGVGAALDEQSWKRGGRSLVEVNFGIEGRRGLVPATLIVGEQEEVRRPRGGTVGRHEVVHALVEVETRMVVRRRKADHGVADFRKRMQLRKAVSLQVQEVGALEAEGERFVDVLRSRVRRKLRLVEASVAPVEGERSPSTTLARKLASSSYSAGMVTVYEPSDPGKTATWSMVGAPPVQCAVSSMDPLASPSTFRQLLSVAALAAMTESATPPTSSMLRKK